MPDLSKIFGQRWPAWSQPVRQGAFVIEPRVLAETLAWCALKEDVFDPVTALRTPRLRPPPAPDSTRHDVRDWEFDWGHGPEAVSFVAERRREALSARGWSWNSQPPMVLRGRIVRCRPRECLTDGASEAESKGFFDMGEVPPWDTWLDWDSGRDSPKWLAGSLLAYVPEQYVALAEEGMQVNAMDCIEWLT